MLAGPPAGATVRGQQRPPAPPLFSFPNGTFHTKIIAVKSLLPFLLTFAGSLAFVLMAAPPLKAATAGIGPSFKGPLGLQLYSLREEFAKDVPGTHDKLKAFGFKNVELAGTYG